MKNILLSSVAIVAFAGAAAAEISFSGSATLGYNDDHENGIYADSDLDITMSQELNNGWTASVTYGLELEQHEKGVENGGGDDGQDKGAFDGNLLVSLTNGSYGVYYGETSYAAESLWSGVSEMAQDGFSENDGEEVLKATAMVGDIEVAASAVVDNMSQETDQASFGAKGSFGNVTFSLAYQEEAKAGYTYNTTTEETTLAGGTVTTSDFNAADVLGLAIGTSFAGADVTVAYAKSGDEDSTGIEVSYPVGPVTVGAFYVSESANAEDTYGVSAAYAEGAIEATLSHQSVNTAKTTGLEGSYTVSDELSVFAGYISSDDKADDGSYIGVEYDLGGGASLLASYADVDATNATDDEFGAKDYKAGATLALSLKF